MIKTIGNLEIPAAWWFVCQCTAICCESTPYCDLCCSYGTGQAQKCDHDRFLQSLKHGRHSIGRMLKPKKKRNFITFNETGRGSFSVRCHVATINNGKRNNWKQNIIMHTIRKMGHYISRTTHMISWMENITQMTKRMALLLSIWTICVKRSRDIRRFKELPNDVKKLLNQTHFHKAPVIN